MPCPRCPRRGVRFRGSLAAAPAVAAAWTASGPWRAARTCDCRCGCPRRCGCARRVAPSRAVRPRLAWADSPDGSRVPRLRILLPLLGFVVLSAASFSVQVPWHSAGSASFLAASGVLVLGAAARLAKLEQPEQQADTVQQTLLRCSDLVVSPRDRPEDEVCAVCLESLCRGELLRLHVCKHTFHTKCLGPWYKVLANDRQGAPGALWLKCPLCRQCVGLVQPE